MTAPAVPRRMTEAAAGRRAPPTGTGASAWQSTAGIRRISPITPISAATGTCVPKVRVHHLLADAPGVEEA